LVERNGHTCTSPTRRASPSTPPQCAKDAAELTHTLYHAGNWLQASFGSNDNLFTTAGLDLVGKRAVSSSSRRR